MVNNGDTFFLPSNMSAALCMICDTDMCRPKGWRKVPINGMNVIVSCAHCRNDYSVLMSIEQAMNWDNELEKQFRSMEVSAKALAASQ